MSLSAAEIESIVRDLAPRLQGGRIERIDQPQPQELVLTIRNGPGLYWLLISAHPRFSRLHLLPRRPEQGEPAAGFCNVARQHLTGAPVEQLRQVPRDRVVVLESSEHDRLRRAHRVALVAELTGVGSNLLLLDESERVLGSLHREDSTRRSIYPGAEYVPLQPPAELPPVALENRFEGAADPDDPLALSRAVHAHYAPRVAEQELRQAREDLLQALRREADRHERRLGHVCGELERAAKAESWRRKGELLKLALPRIERGQAQVKVEDVFEPDRPEVTIELNPALSPTANLEQMFEKYRKALAGREELQRRAARTRATLERLEGLRRDAEGAESPERVAELRTRARSAGLLRPPRKHPERAGRPKGPRRFVSADGLEILVARDQRQNERLTFVLANGNDYWLHVRGWPGPHVVLRHAPDGGAPQESLLDAAHLAVRFSKIRDTDYAEVAYTQCKHVRRLKGAPTGKVSYANESTLQVRIEPGRLERLLSSDGVE